MKTLQESLFDHDIIKNSDVNLGELYELSNQPHQLCITNDIDSVIRMFDIDEIKKIKFKFEVDKKNSCIDHWRKFNPDLILILNLLLNSPMTEFKTKERINKYINKFLKPYYHKSNHVFITSLTNSKDLTDLLRIDIYDDIFDSRPSSIKLTFKKK